MLQLTYPWLLLLLPLPLLIYLLAPAYSEPRLAVRVPFMGLLLRLTGQQAGSEAASIRRTPLQKAQLLLSWVAIVIALARPTWMDQPMVQELPMRDLLVALDLSGSMETRDFTDEAGNTSDRLSAAKQVLDQFLSRREGDRVGLIFFGSAAFVQAPFTEDLDVVRELLDEAQVRMLGPRTMLGDAIGVAIRLFERSEVDERVLIVLTDGNDTGSMVPPLRAAEIARDNGVTIYPIAMGDPEAAGEQALDEVTLNSIAAATGGEYFHADDREQLDLVYQALDRLNPKQVETASYRPEHELYHWPLGFAIILSLLFFAQSELRMFLASRAARGPEAGA
ncbi:MAG: VWA domain-containing protein [Xanthomonadales bacterium]|nr:VWA domain-containing protein [Gammaproteobacteria bacterium]MBT8052566.1 VWA domain-containing protein [Gammaproteobacteria bacterium]NND57753.1 VWA domain-containing protein [Xanthomonadales bacterium]NNK51468.1 VWA domain-containing protein [Xanthomonadales bacterium]